MKLTLILAIAASSCGLLNAGPLNPPAGAIVSTGKTLAEVEPRTIINAANTPGDANSLFRISQPGSYILTGNVIGVAGKRGIEIAASGVTIDLQGFRLEGLTGTLEGIYGEAGAAQVTVRNGAVTAWRSTGIDLSNNQCAVEKVTVSSNTGGGIRVGTAGLVMDCSAWGNLGAGIVLDGGSRAVNCVARSGSAAGLVSGDGCVIDRCVATFNSGNGIDAGGRCVVTGCAATYNGGTGIATSLSASVSGCTASSNQQHGISAANGCSVTDCVVRENAGNGIVSIVATTIRGCTVVGNTGDGVLVERRCVVSENSLIGNGAASGNGANIHVVDAGNRIDGNTCMDSDRGIDVDVSGNVITRNICSGNTVNWTVVANNACQVVIVIGSGAINGNSGGVAIGSTDPYVNFSF